MSEVETYTWRSREFPKEDGYYWYDGVIYYEDDLLRGTRYVKVLVKVVVEKRIVILGGETHHAVNCHGDFTGPLAPPPSE